MILDADVIVVGAGPAGSTAAARLAARGRRVILVDKAKFPRDKPCGDYCNPGAVNILRRHGHLTDVLSAGAAQIAGMAVYAQDGSSVEGPFPVGSALLIPRRQLDAVLLARAARAGAKIVDGAAVETVQVHSDGVETRLISGHSLRAQVLIAADGMRSTVGRRLGRFSPPVAGRYTVGAYFSGLPYATPRGELHLGPGHYCGVAHFGGGAANICMALPRHLWRGRDPATAFAAALTSLPVLADTMAGARREGAFRCTGPVGFAARVPVTDRIVLIGDAAGQTEPMTGQGIFLALRSAELAAESVGDALDVGDLSRRRLWRYALRHRREVAGGLTAARWLQHLAFHARLTPALVRRLAARRPLVADLFGVTGNVLPPSRLLSPAYLVRLFL